MDGTETDAAQPSDPGQPDPSRPFAPAVAPPDGEPRTVPTFPSFTPDRRRGQILGLSITAGLIAFCAVCGIAAAAIQRERADDPPPSSAPTTPASTRATGDSGNAAARIGVPVRDGALEFTVTGERCGVRAVGTGALAATATGQFCLVTIQVRNVGLVAQSFSATDQAGYAGTGQRYAASGVASLYANRAGLGGAAFGRPLVPAGRASGVIVFDLPATARITRIELHGARLSGGVQVLLTR